jgi:hypothetical protein
LHSHSVIELQDDPSLSERMVFFVRDCPKLPYPSKSNLSDMYLKSICFVHPIILSLVLGICDFLLVFFRLAHLALHNVNKEYVIFLHFCNFVAKSEKKPKTKNGMNILNTSGNPPKCL